MGHTCAAVSCPNGAAAPHANIRKATLSQAAPAALSRRTTGSHESVGLRRVDRWCSVVLWDLENGAGSPGALSAAGRRSMWVS